MEIPEDRKWKTLRKITSPPEQAPGEVTPTEVPNPEEGTWIPEPAPAAQAPGKVTPTQVTGPREETWIPETSPQAHAPGRMTPTQVTGPEEERGIPEPAPAVEAPRELTPTVMTAPEEETWSPEPASPAEAPRELTPTEVPDPDEERWDPEPAPAAEAPRELTPTEVPDPDEERWDPEAAAAANDERRASTMAMSETSLCETEESLPPVAGQEPRSAKVEVLIAHPVASTARLIRETLENFTDCRIVTTSDPLRAFELALQKRFGLFFFAMQTGELSGPMLYELISKACTAGRGPRLLAPAVIFVREKDDPKLPEVLLRDARVKDVLHKPIRIERLLEAVTGILEVHDPTVR